MRTVSLSGVVEEGGPAGGAEMESRLPMGHGERWC